MHKEESVHGCIRAKYKTNSILDDASYYFCSRGNVISESPTPSKFVNKITIKDWLGYTSCYIL